MNSCNFFNSHETHTNVRVRMLVGIVSVIIFLIISVLMHVKLRKSGSDVVNCLTEDKPNINIQVSLLPINSEQKDLGQNQL